MTDKELILGVSDFVALLNQTLEFAYPNVVIEGELANLRVSKNRWVYFDLKDEYSSVKFFGTVYQLPGPLEDGMMLRVKGSPRLHQQYGFSVNVQSMQPVGEGSIKKAAALLEAKLAAEGLFDETRKRRLPYPPSRIGLIASSESAAYIDFMKILNARWGGVEVMLADVQVQGDAAVTQVVSAIEHFNSHAEQVDVLVVTRGGGSPEDLAAFNSEQVTRAVAGSRIPTMVAIGHERDISLAELAADQRASTPSNAAELLVPDKEHLLSQLPVIRKQIAGSLDRMLDERKSYLVSSRDLLNEAMRRMFDNESSRLRMRRQLLEALNPSAALKRGYAIIRQQGRVLRSISDVRSGQIISVEFSDGSFKAKVESKE